MTGGAGYALSREAARMFVSGHASSSKCRPGDVGPEDVEMSRCLQRLGVSFVDTRDKMGRYECISYSEKILDFLLYLITNFLNSKLITSLLSMEYLSILLLYCHTSIFFNLNLRTMLTQIFQK